MYRLLSLAVVLSLTSTSNAQLQIKPATPTPTPLIREAFMPKGEVLLSYPMEATLDGKPIWLWKYHHRKVDDLVVTNARGEKLTDEEIRKVLSKPTMVLVSADGQPIHKYYLTVFKPETLVIIDKTPKRESPNREPVKLKTKDIDSPKRKTPEENKGE